MPDQRTTSCFAMVCLLECVFTEATEKAKFLKMSGCSATFMGFDAFDGDCVEGVRLI